MKTINSHSESRVFSTPKLIHIGDKALEVNTGGSPKMYNLEKVKEIHLYHTHEKGRKGSPYACKVRFKNHRELWVTNSDDEDYSKFIFDLHQAVAPYVDTIRFRKTNQNGFTAKWWAKVGVALLVTIILAPLLMAAYLFRVPVKPVGPEGKVTRLLSEIDNFVQFRVKRYKPGDIPSYLIPWHKSPTAVNNTAA
jgi:hypothetical protein